jgi:hypothetical protein
MIPSYLVRICVVPRSVLRIVQKPPKFVYLFKFLHNYTIMMVISGKVQCSLSSRYGTEEMPLKVPVCYYAKIFDWSKDPRLPDFRNALATVTLILFVVENNPCSPGNREIFHIHSSYVTCSKLRPLFP